MRKNTQKPRFSLQEEKITKWYMYFPFAEKIYSGQPKLKTNLTFNSQKTGSNWCSKILLFWAFKIVSFTRNQAKLASLQGCKFMKQQWFSDETAESSNFFVFFLSSIGWWSNFIFLFGRRLRISAVLRGGNGEVSCYFDAWGFSTTLIWINGASDGLKVSKNPMHKFCKGENHMAQMGFVTSQSTSVFFN